MLIFGVCIVTITMSMPDLIEKNCWLWQVDLKSLATIEFELQNIIHELTWIDPVSWLVQHSTRKVSSSTPAIGKLVLNFDPV